MEKIKEAATPIDRKLEVSLTVTADILYDHENDVPDDQMSACTPNNDTNPFWAPSLHALYKTIKCLSEGSPSSVYIVLNRVEKKRYALKKIECQDESDARRVFFEVTELLKLAHPNITIYKEFFITYEKECCSVYVNVISQYFSLDTLRHFIKVYQDQKTSMPEQVAKKILGEILQALVYLHDNGYLHRNIKPNNIFQRKGGAMVLGDMGVASVMGDMRSNTRQVFRVLLNMLTASVYSEQEYYKKLGQIKEMPEGTVFMAPEIGQMHHNMKTDLYSVGGVLLNMLTASVYSEQEYYKKLGQIKETPEVLSVVLDEVSNTYSKTMISTVQMLLRHKHTNRPSTLEFIKSGFIQECMALADIGQLDRSSWEKTEASAKLYHLTENRDDTFTVLKYIADIMDSEECLADGLSALADILRDNDIAHELIDQKARSLIHLVMANSIFNKDIQIPGCYILSNLIVSATPNDVLFSHDVYSMIHKIMTGHEYNPEVQLAAVDLILALSTNEKAAQAIVQSGGIQDILRAMRHARYHATLNAICCMALWSLTVDSESLKVAGKEKASKDVCLALYIHKVSPDVCESAAAALVSLLLDDGCYDIFDELDCVGNLVAAIYIHTKHAKVVKNCCKVLATAIEADEDCGYRFIANDNEEDESPRGIQTVMKAYNVHRDNADVVESIVRLLLELSQYDDIAAELKAADVSSSLLQEVHTRYKQNKAIMGPVEKALQKLDMPVTTSSRGTAPAPANQRVLPNRPFRFGGEVQESCKAMTRQM